MPEPEEKPLLDFGRARRVKGQGFYIKLPLAERLRAARGVPQAVVKVMRKFPHGARGVKKVIDYISRKGELELETESGDRIKGREEQAELVKEWAIDFDSQANSRDAAHVVFSMPPGSNPDALRKAVRTVGHEAFPDNDWVFAIHEDRTHPHAHMVVKMRGREQGKKLMFKKADLYKLREKFAEAGRAQGVPLAASPRAARGIGRKGMTQAIRQLRDKKILPEVWKEAFKETLKERSLPEKPWEKAMNERNQMERAAYREEAQKLLATASAQTDLKKKESILKAARDLERFSRTMPKPKTRRQVWLERERQKVEEQRREKTRNRDRDEGMER